MGLTIFIIIFMFFLLFLPIILIVIGEKLQNREIKKKILPEEISNILKLVEMSKTNYS